MPYLPDDAPGVGHMAKSDAAIRVVIAGITGWVGVPLADAITAS